jgi:hypothetical protein
VASPLKGDTAWRAGDRRQAPRLTWPVGPGSPRRLITGGTRGLGRGLDNAKPCAAESTVSAQAREPPSTGCTKQELVYARTSAAPVVIGTG